MTILACFVIITVPYPPSSVCTSLLDSLRRHSFPTRRRCATSKTAISALRSRRYAQRLARVASVLSKFESIKHCLALGQRQRRMRAPSIAAYLITLGHARHVLPTRQHYQFYKSKSRRYGSQISLVILSEAGATTCELPAKHEGNLNPF